MFDIFEDSPVCFHFTLRLQSQWTVNIRLGENGLNFSKKRHCLNNKSFYLSVKARTPFYWVHCRSFWLEFRTFFNIQIPFNISNPWNFVGFWMYSNALNWFCIQIITSVNVSALKIITSQFFGTIYYGAAVSLTSQLDSISWNKLYSTHYRALRAAVWGL